jgi:hypothetical protein
LNEHSFAHPDITHQNRGLLDVLDQNELAPAARQILLSAELVITLLHLCVDHQSVRLSLPHLLDMDVDDSSAAEVLLEGEEMSVIVMKNIFLKCELNKLELVGYI